MVVDEIVTRIDELHLNGFPHDHVQLVCDTVQEFQPDIICEWGTDGGNSCRMLYEASVLSSCQVHSIENGIQGRPPLLLDCDVNLHHGDGLTIALTLTTGSERPLILIDDHHVFQTTYDNLVVLNEVRPNAVLLIHDAAASEAVAAIKLFLVLNDGYDVRVSPIETGLMRLWPQSTST